MKLPVAVLKRFPGSESHRTVRCVTEDDLRYLLSFFHHHDFGSWPYLVHWHNRQPEPDVGLAAVVERALALGLIERHPHKGFTRTNKKAP